MGLAVSQVRLLALTNRKADIELNMQIDSKRKMMLTRKSTELAQQYYSKLQHSNIQYATSAGFEDVNYAYLMGDSMDGRYTSTFLSTLAYGSASPKKPENNMILVNQYGQVITNYQLAEIVQKTKDNYSDRTIVEQASYAILELVKQNKNPNGNDQQSSQALSELCNLFTTNDKFDKSKFDNLAADLALLLKIGGYKGEKTIYSTTNAKDITKDTKNLYASYEDFKNKVNSQSLDVFEQGYFYTVQTTNGALNGTGFYGANGLDSDMTMQNIQHLNNLISYFGPILTAALQNGTSIQVTKTGADVVKNNSGNSTIQIDGETLKYHTNGTNLVAITISDTDTAASVLSKLNNACSIASTAGGAYVNLPNHDTYVAVNTNDGTHYYKISYIKNGTSQPKWSVAEISEKDYQGYETDESTATSYKNALNTEKLQAGFRSGIYQLAMVSDSTHGVYHKNTTLNYFTHMNYVVEKTDSSQREKITAWFNAEQAEISAQETYWDTEIQNLSAELNSVNTEISSVKQLKSDNIKSVFNWGNS